MPTAGETATPQSVIERALKRYKAGTVTVTALQKELRVARSTIYLWINADNAKQMERIKRAGLTPADAQKADKLDLALENKALREENAKLWEKIKELMLKTGEI